ncbi:MAG: polyphenol oxidase family protein [Endomicrobium sp.]|jgi:YfiH family protein|nr:polyphenol oxidase family protein [Endomicrobium sp.]
MKNFISNPYFPKKHLTTTSVAGNMKNKKIRNAFFDSLNLNSKNLVLAKQIHSSNVKIVSILNKGTFIDNCDGLITTDKNIKIGVFTADCVPMLLFYADNIRVIKAAIHIGWKGLYNNIIENIFDILKSKYSVKTYKVKIYIGPHICFNCYKVDYNMETKFNIKLINNKFSLSRIIYNKLKIMCVTENNIFAFDEAKYCTFHTKDLFFSYRKNHTYKRILSII